MLQSQTSGILEPALLWWKKCQTRNLAGEKELREEEIQDFRFSPLKEQRGEHWY